MRSSHATHPPLSVVMAVMAVTVCDAAPFSDAGAVAVDARGAPALNRPSEPATPALARVEGAAPRAEADAVYAGIRVSAPWCYGGAERAAMLLAWVGAQAMLRGQPLGHPSRASVWSVAAGEPCRDAYAWPLTALPVTDVPCECAEGRAGDCYAVRWVDDPAAEVCEL